MLPKKSFRFKGDNELKVGGGAKQLPDKFLNK